MGKVTFLSLRALGVLMMAVALVGSAVVFNGPQPAAAQTALCLDAGQFGQFDTNGDDVISRDELLAAGASESDADLAANFILTINCDNPITIDLGRDGEDRAGASETPGTNGDRDGDKERAGGDGTAIDQDRRTVRVAAQTPLCLDVSQFGKFDTNRDNVISRKELLAGGATETQADLARNFILNINCDNPIVIDINQGGTATDATPAAVGEEAFIAPDPTACQVEPRTANELLALWYNIEGTPVAAQATPEADQAAANDVTIPVGSPADETTTTAVVATTRLVFSCFEAGDTLRAYALFTDDLARQSGPEPGTTREEAEALLTETEPESDGGEIIGVANVMVLTDGRVGAFVIDRGEEATNVVYAIFEQQDDRWLVDEVIEFSSPGDEEEADA